MSAIASFRAALPPFTAAGGFNLDWRPLAICVQGADYPPLWSTGPAGGAPGWNGPVHAGQTDWLDNGWPPAG